MPGTAVVKVAPASGQAITGTGKTAEDVPAVFHGCKTKALTFGSVPKSLHGVKREIGRRSSEVRRYRSAVKAAAGKPKVEHALQHNVTALEGRLRELHRQLSLLRRAAAKKKITKRLGRQLGKLTGYERSIESKGRVYEIANQTAEQIVGLEPLPPELPETASNQEREDAEKAFVQQLKGYIDTRERPAYEGVLERVGDWRNTVLEGEAKATSMEHGWEGGIRRTDAEIDAINDLTKKVTGDVREWHTKHPKDPEPDWLKKEIKQMHQERAKLPVLRFRDHELRNVLGEARGVFWRGVKDPVQPPQPPLEGTGSFEDTLQGIQGIHWPDQHSIVPKLPSKRVAGQFGGAVWDTQTIIAELDLKIAGGGGDDEGKSLREELETELALQRTRATNLTAANLGELTGFLQEFKSQLPYVGAFATGGMVPGPMGRPALATVHGGETILRADQSGSPVVIHLHGDMADLVAASAEGMVGTVDRRLGRNSRVLAFAPGRG
jgi:hypothetical protein